jgi:predicted TIM-barrel fold metal-dependent hydrolase
MNESRVDKSVVFQLTRMVKRDNTEVARIVQKNSQRLIGYAHINPHADKEPVKEMDRAIRKLSLKGIKVHPALDGFAIHDEIMHPVMKKAQELQIPVLTHSGWSYFGCGSVFAQPLQCLFLAEQFPKVTFIIAHMGGGNNIWTDAIKAAKKSENIFLDTTGQSPMAIEKAIDEIGAERILFGTDAPWAFHILEVKKIEMLKAKPEEKELILGKNIAKILKLPV